ncbi:MAG: phenylacetate--CoA ligase family protein [Acidobacteria bacterium]|nr:phenylacetate--CoA ligase family protein [Acidobacteriota bacterium]
MGKLDAIYEKLPVWAQHAAVSLYGLHWYQRRFGGGYQTALADFLRRERFSVQEWQAWQATALKHLLTAAAQHVPYYRQQWSSTAQRAALAGNLEELPLLEKDAVRADAYAFLRDDCPRQKLETFYTSGSTGTPIASLWTVEELRASMAVREARSARWAGVSFQRPRATFSGRMVEPNPASQGPFYRFNLAERQVYLSPFHLRPDTARQYVAALHKHKIEWLTGYAVSYHLLAQFMLAEGIAPPPLKAVITTSEKVTDEMRVVMERAYGCKVYEEYSTVENVLFASECAHGRLHVSPDVGIVEILRPDGSPCAPGEVGEVVATGLLRCTQPLIRFRLGDMAAWAEPYAPCPCGKALPVIKEVVGRIEDVITGPDGRQLVRFHGIFVNQPHIREGQVIQEALDRIRVKIVPVNGFGAADVTEIEHRIQQRLGAAVQVIVEPVKSIPRTASGKFKAVISLLPHNAKAPSN